jgi:tetratricopeptide (TPR) repeat protein
MHSPTLKFCVLLALVASSLPAEALAQTTPPSTVSGGVAYTDEPIVIERADTVISMATDGTGWKEHTLIARLQSDATVKKYGVLSVPYASNSEHVELLYARVRHPDGTVAETQTSDAMDMPSPVTRQAPFYSDQKELQLPIRSLRVGDTLELKYRIIRTKADVPGQFWGQEIFTDSAVVLSQTGELRVPTGIYINVWSPSIKPVESSSDAIADAPAQHIYRWSHSQLNPTAGKDAEAAAAAKKKILWTADQELDLEQGKLPTIAWTTFRSWEEIGAWYHSLEADRIVADDTVKAKAAELTAGKSTDEAKARALYDYVATNIRYIGVAFGIGRYQPHTAAEILSNQYGDCKDKHTLLAALLATQGIQSDAVLIGSRIRFNEAVPSPASFNHLITHLTLAGKPVWLDTTAEVAPFGMLTITTRDKQALMIPATAVAAIVRTPVDATVPQTVRMDAVGSLDATGVSASHIVLTLRGDGEIVARAGFRQLPLAQYDQAVQIFSKAIGFTGTATNPDISRPTDTTQPFKLSYDYKREKAGDWEHLKTIPQVMPVLLPGVTGIDPPVHAIQLGIPRTEDSISSMKLPDGWTAIFPPAVHAKCAYGTYDMTYRLDGNIVYAERHLVILQKKVPVSDWQAYKAWVDKVNPGRERYIQLSTAVAPKALVQRTKQIEDALNSPDPMLKNSVAYALATTNKNLSDAQALAEQAVQLQEKTTSQIVSMEDKVKSFDQMGILGADWETLGWVYYRQGQQEKAEAYMHAAWELKPRNSDINLYMALIYEAQHKLEDATIFYRMALSATNSPTTQNVIHTRLDHLGVTAADPLPTDVMTPLPSLTIQLNAADTEPLVDILLTHDKPPAVTLLKGDPALEEPLVKAIQSALANPFPDAGPEKLLRRARVTCSSGDRPVCALHFLGSQVAMEASSNANQGKAGH